MARILIDSGFWLGLYDQQDQWHNQAKAVAHKLTFHQWLLPWPTLYETLSTRFVKKSHQVEKFMAELNNGNHQKIDHAKYRESALSQATFYVLQGRTLSLVDLVLRQMLFDETLHIKAIVTFNPRDFSDVCHRQGIQLYSELN